MQQDNAAVREFLSVIWDEQPGPLVSLVGDPQKQRWFGSAAAALDEARRATFFGIHGRKSAEATKAGLCDEGNVVWIDVDPSKEMDRDEQLQVLREGLEGRGVPPTILMSSGHGFWAFWKLERCHPWRDLEQVNRGLARALRDLGADQGAWDATRICRVPGTWNEKWGRPRRRVEVLAIDPARRYELVDLCSAFAVSLDDAEPSGARRGGRGTSAEPIRRPKPARRDDDRWRHRTGPVSWRPNEEIRAYLETGEAEDRSRLEHQIVGGLWWAGYTRREIHDWFSTHRPARWREKRNAGHAVTDIDRSVDKYLVESAHWEPPLSASPRPSCVSEEWTQCLPEEPQRHRYARIDRVAVLLAVRGQPAESLAAELVQTLGASRSGVKKVLADLKRRGVVVAGTDPADRRRRTYHLPADVARNLTARWPRNLRFLSKIGDPRAG